MHEPEESEKKHDDARGEVLPTPRGTKTVVGTSNTMENGPFRNWENLKDLTRQFENRIVFI